MDMDVKFFVLIGIFCQIYFAKTEENDSNNDNKKESEETAILELTPQDDDEQPKFNTNNEEFQAEQKAGNVADLFATNQHVSYPDTYIDLGRRFVPQYPYKEENSLDKDKEAEVNLDKTLKDFLEEEAANNRLKPVKAPPELVLAIAKESAALESTRPNNPSERLIEKDILRSGNYWNSVWKEDIGPKILRSRDENIVRSVKATIMPGSNLYQLVTALSKISPRLIYVINKN